MLQKITIAKLMMLISCAVSVAAERVVLPSDPQASVVELWYLDDSSQPQPEVAVLADGRVWFKSVDGPAWSRIQRTELIRLVTDLLEGDGLKHCDSHQLKRALQQEAIRTGLTADVPGAASTFIRIRTGDAVRQIQCPAVGVLATRFPEVQSVQQVLSAQRRLENLRAVAMVGGSQAAADLARIAQATLAEDYGVAVPVSAEDLAMVRKLPDGGKYCQFLVGTSSKGSQSSRIISVFDIPGNAPRVSMLGDGLTIQ